MHFDSFAELKGNYWHVLDEQVMRLTNITYPSGSHYGAATRKQGYKLNSIREEYSDDYGVFGVSSDSPINPEYPPLNNAPSNWSCVDLDKQYVYIGPSK